MRRLTTLIHGDAGTGKSWLAVTAPGPRLLLDVEGRADFLPGKKIAWDPRGPVPDTAADEATTTVVDVQEAATVRLVEQWLASGKHPFESVVIDSLTELQQRTLDAIAGVQAPDQQAWGRLLRELEADVRRFRDFRKHPTCPVNVIVLAGSKEANGKQRPYLQGQLGIKVAYHFDLVGYLTVTLDESGQPVRVLQIQPIGPFEAKDNTHDLSLHYGVQIVRPDISEMLTVLNNGKDPR